MSPPPSKRPRTASQHDDDDETKLPPEPVRSHPASCTSLHRVHTMVGTPYQRRTEDSALTSPLPSRVPPGFLATEAHQPFAPQDSPCGPIRIFLIRHGESEGNVDPTVYRHLPDHAIPLTTKGKEMATSAGKFLKEYFLNTIHKEHNIEALDCLVCKKEHHVRMLVSPYERTRQTAEEILKVLNDLPTTTATSPVTLVADDTDGDTKKNTPTNSSSSPVERQQSSASFDSAVNRNGEKQRVRLVHSVKESCYLAEQDFGLAEGDGTVSKEKYSEELLRIDRQRQFRGKFWSRFPQGESPFDVTIRMGGVLAEIITGSSLETATRGRIHTYILVSHGLTIRAFLAAWCHLSPEWISESWNPPNCSIQLVENTTLKGYLYGGYDHGKEVAAESILLQEDPRQRAWDRFL